MNTELIINNILQPPILFFFLGLLAVYFKSTFEMPPPLPRFFSYYLLFSIGFKGGEELRHSGFNLEVMYALLAAIFIATLIPFYTFFILKKKVGLYNAGAIAATYGSVSAVTFITTASFLSSIKLHFGGHMVAAMAMMESPAIIIGVYLTRKYLQKEGGHAGQIVPKFSRWQTTKEALLDGSVFLLLGSLLIGMISSEKQAHTITPFTESIFKGMLCFFLLEMGLQAGKRMKEIFQSGFLLVGFAIIAPVINAFIGISFAYLIGLSVGNALILSVLAASASYIAVPAAMRIAIPEASPGIYIPMALAITFPFNIVVGIPLYYQIIVKVWEM
ncbi:MAG: sodium-dependent bicarbonate transport family permease [Cytophagales bacterium]|nr:sodium-dependent bicarbonate transport family permease [Cytophagales bacterium]MDW8383458.1 sodium-dependent bicarbonate transport family permease [Flammeovirgaceae bacterium]